MIILLAMASDSENMKTEVTEDFNEVKKLVIKSNAQKKYSNELNFEENVKYCFQESEQRNEDINIEDHRNASFLKKQESVLSTKSPENALKNIEGYNRINVSIIKTFPNGNDDVAQLNNKLDSKSFVDNEVNTASEIKFGCKQCSYVGRHSGHVNQHVKMVHSKIKDLECNFCDYITGVKQHLKRHMKRKHRS